MVLKLSEQVRRLEDTIESLRKENRDLRRKVGIVAEETIQDLQKRIAELSRELKARVEQVENLQDTLKKITKELKSKLEQTVDKYDEDYQTFHNNCKCTKKCGEEELHPYGRSIADYIEDDDMREIFKKFLGNENS